MCGRYSHFFTWKQLHRLLGGWSPPEQLEALKSRYNVAPLQSVPVVRTSGSGEREVAFLSWGLVPKWADDPAMGSSLINARAETAASKPAFRESMRSQRCLVPVSGFYEWQKRPDGSKQPFFITRSDGEPFLLAGLWASWDKGDAPLQTFAVLTSAPNDLMAPIHDRMPVAIDSKDADCWLDPSITDPAAVADLLRPRPLEGFEVIPVSNRVNRVANDDASLIRRVEPDSGLFG